MFRLTLSIALVTALTGCAILPMNPCEQADGVCVALAPGACTSGRFGDPASCGGVGAACCLTATDAGPSVSNPADAYCNRLGYQTNDTSECVFPDGSRCETFSFFRGTCGTAWTRCAQSGGSVASVTFDRGSWTGNVSRCTLPSGATCDEVSFATSGVCP